MRIVSLVPSLSKTICDLGLKANLVGITNFCVDPPDLYRSAMRVGGTKDPNLSQIHALNATHVIVNEEENRATDIEQLRKSGNVLSTFPKSPEDVGPMLRVLGKFLGSETRTREVAACVEEEISKLASLPKLSSYVGRKFLYLIWRDPWMAVAKETYISRFLELLGFENLVNSETRYPVIEVEQIKEMAPDVIFLSSEPWPFRKRDAEALRNQLGPMSAKMLWIDGKYCSWYGTTTIEALQKAQLPYDKNPLIRPI